jgi:hypothetical protein
VKTSAGLSLILVAFWARLSFPFLLSYAWRCSSSQKESTLAPAKPLLVYLFFLSSLARSALTSIMPDENRERTREVKSTKADRQNIFVDVRQFCYRFLSNSDTRSIRFRIPINSFEECFFFFRDAFVPSMNVTSFDKFAGFFVFSFRAKIAGNDDLLDLFVGDDFKTKHIPLLRSCPSSRSPFPLLSLINFFDEFYLPSLSSLTQGLVIERKGRKKKERKKECVPSVYLSFAFICSTRV